MNNFIKNIYLFLIPCLLLLSTNVNSQTVATFAGSSNYGQTDGIGASATFISPVGIAKDINGNIFITDCETHRVRKITPNGTVTTLAGSTQGYTDGIGITSKFNSPQGIDVDNNGNVYVADCGNNCIRKITPDGNVTTLAGGTLGTANGTGTDAQFNNPYGIAVDNFGNIFVSDKFNNRIQKITSTGLVSTFADYSTGLFYLEPFGITVDNNGNVFVAYPYIHTIVKISALGISSIIAGGNGTGNIDGAANVATFHSPVDLDVDNVGNIFVADLNNHRIRKIAQDGQVTTIAGSTVGFLNGIGNNTKFSSPYGITVTTNDEIFVADLSNHRIRKISNYLSIEDNKLENLILIYPNPTSKYLNIELNNSTIFKISIYDLNGRALEGIKNIANNKIDVSNLANGFYTLNIITNKGIITKKIIKE
jgi:sugar lactone lactonase YvrE